MKKLWIIPLAMLMVATLAYASINVGQTLDTTKTLITKIANTMLAISRGDVSGKSTINKFGNAPDFDKGDGVVTIWDGADDGTAWEKMVYTYSTTADIDSISSSEASDNQEMELQGLGATTNLVVQNVTLDGTNRVALGTSLYRVFRAKNINGTTNAGHIIVYTNEVTTAGVPTASAIRAVVQPQNQQTEMALYTVPAGKTAFMMSFYAGTAGASKSSEYIITMYARKPNGVFQLKHRSALSDSAGIHFNHIYKVYPSFTEGTDIEMRVEIPSGTATAGSISAGFDLILCDN